MTTAHYLALALMPGIGPKTARRLLERFGGAQAVFDAPAADLASVPRVTPAIAERLLASPLDQYEQELLSLDDVGIRAVSLEDEAYPANLRRAADSPILLFYRGALDAIDAEAVAVVGSRSASPAGREHAARLAEALAGQALTIVSGLALGIDTAAHQGALNGGGRTLAVLGSGINVVHPRENLELAEEIAQSGALLSELHPNAPPSGPTLMARDRIVSGLARAVIVMEAGLRSGSLDTAARAVKQGRLLYAVPGSEGADSLLRSGARPLETNEDFERLAQEVRAAPPGASGAPAQPALF